MNESKIELTERLRAEGRWVEASNFKETVRADLRAKGMGRQEAVEASWEAMAEAYPPLPVVEATAEPASISGRVQGLGDIPASWGTLPANASLQSELNWVQANRLLIVEETPSGATRVHLDRARSPAPSQAALGWLETSIRTYAKYVDVLARSLKDEVDEVENVRRERMQLDEIGHCYVRCATMSRVRGRRLIVRPPEIEPDPAGVLPPTTWISRSGKNRPSLSR